ncbi:hypothetical protein [Paraburkholderia aspalathi]|uniref:hypothetical protein n=1 Tax=Paraburkholderia aspalathi TaxID=1324617 RepID=UPI00190DBAD2|nr:hypothetical protein [Paraburkholderia aspalathi]MBK3836930.1 hypothetical protein [Paraburkholderia aspalathi]
MDTFTSVRFASHAKGSRALPPQSVSVGDDAIHGRAIGGKVLVWPSSDSAVEVQSTQANSPKDSSTVRASDLRIST